MATSPPTGTLTFLFTDIEGSTRLWENNAPAMQAALARHDELLKLAIEEHGGYVFKTAGDAFCAVFPTASDALEAALEIQRRLLSSDWEQTGPLRRVMHNRSDQKVGQVAQRSPELVVEPLPASVGRHLGRQAGQTPEAPQMTIVEGWESVRTFHRSSSYPGAAERALSQARTRAAR